MGKTGEFKAESEIGLCWTRVCLVIVPRWLVWEFSKRETKVKEPIQEQLKIFVF